MSYAASLTDAELDAAFAAIPVVRLVEVVEYEYLQPEERNAQDDAEGVRF